MISFMATAVGAVYSAFVALCPVDFVVDCAHWHGGPVKLEYCYETVNGARVQGSAGVQGVGFKPWLLVHMLTEPYERDGWKFEKLHDPDNPMAFVVSGSKNSPIKNVTITGDNWVPIVERRFRPPMKEPMKKRLREGQVEVKRGDVD